MDFSLQIIAAIDPTAQTGATDILTLSNDADVSHIALDGITRIDLHFPKFTD